MTTVFKPRPAWTTQPRGGAALAPRGVIGMGSHWPGSTTDDYGVESEAKVAARLRGWWDYHVNGRGWVDIGYNFAIDQAGRVWDLRGSGRVGAHAASAGNPDANHEWIGVLHILGDEERPTPAMIQAHYDLWDLLRPKFANMDTERGHGSIPGAQTSCPGPFVRAMLAAGRPDAPPPEPPPTEEEDLVKFGIVSEYGATQHVLVRSDGTVQKLSEKTFQGMKADTANYEYRLLTNAQTNRFIALQGYAERRLRAVIWSETFVSRGGQQIPVLQELANIQTDVDKVVELVGGDARQVSERLQELRAAAVAEVPDEIPAASEVMPVGLEYEPDEADAG